MPATTNVGSMVSSSSKSFSVVSSKIAELLAVFFSTFIVLRHVNMVSVLPRYCKDGHNATDLAIRY